MGMTALADFEFHGETIPEYMYDGLLMYIHQHQEPGDFLLAVLSNDLKDACARADDANIRVLHVYVGFLYNHAPEMCWGSREKVAAWIEQGLAAEIAVSPGSMPEGSAP